jgi:hypothetical protein
MRKIILLLILGLVSPISAFAQPVCPVCTVVVAGGVGLCRYLGIDDMISGVWVGALLALLVMWTLKWLDKKNIHFKFRRLLVIIFFYFFTIAPLYWMHIIGQVNNKFLGIDKLVFGTAGGTIVFLAAFIFENKFLRNKNAGKAYFPFQKVVIPVAALLILSFIFNYFC